MGNHSDGEAEQFYRDLEQRGTRVWVGMEATGYSRWFERLLADPAEIQAAADLLDRSLYPQV